MEPESILGVMGGSQGPWNLDFGLGLDNKKTMCILYFILKY